MLNSSSLLVTFDTSRVDMSLDITVAGVRYTTTTPALLTVSGSSFSGTGSLSSGCCGASMLAKGFFAGDAAARAGLAYHVGTTIEKVNGAIAYQKLGGGL